KNRLKAGLIIGTRFRIGFAAASSLASLTGILSSASPPGRTLFSWFLSLTALTNKKTGSRPVLLLVRAQGFEPWTH
ncbi:MAG: hypothetical protein J6N45_03550, partial [Alphaproteobacteria bacterium]|nr:hypothetical protein [Alphaproteobacteria bacterium]